MRKNIGLMERIATHAILLTAVVFTLFPVAWLIGMSVNPNAVISGSQLEIFPSDPSLENFRYVIRETNFMLWLRNSLVVAIGTTALGLFLATTAAYGFSRFDFRGKKGAMLSFLVVQMFPGAIIIIPYFILMSSLGLLDTALGLILAYSVTALPVSVFMMKGFFDTIPTDLEEAARVDGCSRTGAFYRILLPLAKPAIAVTALFSFLAAWNEFLLAYTFMQADEKYTLPVGINSFIGIAPQWGYFAAASILVSIPVVLLMITFQRYLISGLTAGGVKG